jgi:hypothetical protein
MSQTDFTAAKSFKDMIADFRSREIRLYWLRPADNVARTLQAISGSHFR